MMQNPLNKTVMEEIGLTINSQNKVIDQDTRDILTFGDKSIKYSSQNAVSIGHSDMLFDPVNDKKLMSTLFGYYANKLDEEGENGVSLFYEKSNGKQTCVEVKMQDGKFIKSLPYNNVSLSYIDAIKQINGDSNVNLSEFDSTQIASTKHTTKKKPLFTN